MLILEQIKEIEIKRKLWKRIQLIISILLSILVIVACFAMRSGSGTSNLAHAGIFLTLSMSMGALNLVTNACITNLGYHLDLLRYLEDKKFWTYQPGHPEM